MGKDLEIKFYAPQKGKKYLEGTLVGYDKNCITVLVDGEELKLELSKISKVNEAVKF
jgi:ribosome maturation factor RimP